MLSPLTSVIWMAMCVFWLPIVNTYLFVAHFTQMLLLLFHYFVRTMNGINTYACFQYENIMYAWIAVAVNLIALFIFDYTKYFATSLNQILTSSRTRRTVWKKQNKNKLIQTSVRIVLFWLGSQQKCIGKNKIKSFFLVSSTFRLWVYFLLCKKNASTRSQCLLAFMSLPILRYYLCWSDV